MLFSVLIRLAGGTHEYRMSHPDDLNPKDNDSLCDALKAIDASPNRSGCVVDLGVTGGNNVELHQVLSCFSRHNYDYTVQQQP